MWDWPQGRRQSRVRKRSPAAVVITGASSGLGEALALEYAQPGHTLGLIARDRTRLEAVAARCSCKGARCEIASMDVTDWDALQHWMVAFDAMRPIDLLFVNAGVFSGHGPDRQIESIEEVLWQIRVNLEGALLTIAAALPGMRRRRTGRIVLIGSLAALQPLADAPGYSASKAGLMSYGEALREYLAPEGVSVSLVYPGYIQTQQTAHHIGPLPLKRSPARAAATIRAHVDRGRSFIAFPLTLLLLLRLGRLIGWRLRAALGRSLRFYTDKQPDLGTQAKRYSDLRTSKITRKVA